MVNYIYDEVACKNIFKEYPKVKILLVFRNPLEKFYSHCTYRQSLGMMNKSDYISILENDPEFVEEGFYMQFLRKWLEYFPREQIWIGFYDDIKTHPKEMLRDIYSFLEVDSTYMPDGVNKKINNTNQRNNIIVRFLNWMKFSLLKTYVGRAFYQVHFLRNFFRFIKSVAFKYLPARRQSTSSASDLPVDVREKLFKIYIPHIRELEHFANRDLSHWYTLSK